MQYLADLIIADLKRQSQEEKVKKSKTRTPSRTFSLPTFPSPILGTIPLGIGGGLTGFHKPISPKNSTIQQNGLNPPPQAPFKHKKPTEVINDFIDDLLSPVFEDNRRPTQAESYLLDKYISVSSRQRVSSENNVIFKTIAAQKVPLAIRRGAFRAAKSRLAVPSFMSHFVDRMIKQGDIAGESHFYNFIGLLIDIGIYTLNRYEFLLSLYIEEPQWRHEIVNRLPRFFFSKNQVIPYEIVNRLPRFFFSKSQVIPLIEKESDELDFFLALASNSRSWTSKSECIDIYLKHLCTAIMMVHRRIPELIEEITKICPTISQVTLNRLAEKLIHPDLKFPPNTITFIIENDESASQHKEDILNLISKIIIPRLKFQPAQVATTALQASTNEYLGVRGHNEESAEDIFIKEVKKFIPDYLNVDDKNLRHLYRSMGKTVGHESVLTLLQVNLDEFFARSEDRLVRFAQYDDNHVNHNIEVPEVFKDEHELGTFAATRYFMQLPYEDRREFIRQFKDLDRNEALELFFELSGLKKFAQFLANWPDTPKDLRILFEKFEDDVEPSDMSEIIKEINGAAGWEGFDAKWAEAILSSMPRDEFGEIIPLKAGTIGEVYETAPDDVRSVAKIITQFNIKENKKMMERLQIVRRSLLLYQDKIEGAAVLARLIEVFIEVIESELDFKNEYNNAMAMKDTLPQGIGMPGYHASMMADRVIVISYARGKKITQLNLNQQKQTDLAHRLKALMLSMINNGIVHMDLHPGNVFYDKDTDELIIMDFGQVLEMEPAQIDLIQDGLYPALMIENADEILNALEKMGEKGAGYNPKAMKAMIEEELSLLNGTDDMDTRLDLMPKIISNIITRSCMRHYDFKIHKTYIKLLKALTTLMGTIYKLENH